MPRIEKTMILHPTTARDRHRPWEEPIERT